MNNVFGNLDSYVYLPHNYYLYHDTITDKFEWITWDASLAFGVYALLVVPNSIDFDILYLPNDAKNTRPLNFHILKDESLKQQYMGEVCHFLKNEFLPTELFPKIDSLGNLIRPYLEMEPMANRMFSIEEFDSNLEYKTVSYQLLGQVPGLKDFIIRRRKSITRQLCENNWSCSLNQEISDDEVLNIYPNPGNEIKIQFIAPNEFYTSEFLITDLSGKKIRQWTHQNIAGIQEINLKNLESGMYVLKLESGCKSTMKKFVVVK
jgi:spore coat protein CotH